MLRTPLLPRDTLDRWGEGLAVPAAGGDGDQLAAAIEADRRRLRERLAALVARPEVREAVFVASPGLEACIDAWLADPGSEAGQKTERSLVRYVSRMAARPTPFGLFAGTTVGAFAETTHLELAPRAHYRRYTRIDGDYLSAVSDALAADPEIRARLRYRPNTSLCQVAGKLRYAVRREGARRTYSLVTLEPSDYLIATLSRARGGALPGELAGALVVEGDDDGAIDREDADEFIDQLIANQVLVSDLAPLVTGREAADDIIAQLRDIDGAAAGRAADVLQRLQTTLGQLDRAIGNPPAHYRAAADALVQLPAKLELSRVFQVNLVPVGARIELGRDVLDEIQRGIAVVRRLARPRASDELTRFRDAFLDRYEAREVPLAEVLDEESGIGFALALGLEAGAAPLLNGLDLPDAPADPQVPWSNRTSVLARRIATALADGVDEIVLDDGDLAAMEAGAPAAPADAFQVLLSLASAPGGELRISIDSFRGPPGASLLGRFCHSDPALHDVARASIAAEEALRPDAIYAEIVHLTDGRIANVSARPVLRDHEIVYLGRSGAPPDRQLSVSDLLVSVQNGRIVLRSRSLGREVVPRLTSGHRFENGSFGTYRFLASLQHQGSAPLEFDIGPLAQLPHVPRIRCGCVVLREASWTLQQAELEPVTRASGVARLQALHRLRARARLPRWICVVERDNVLPVDLDNVLAVDSFAQLVKDRASVTLSELWPAPGDLVVWGPDGGYANEIVVPFVRVATAAPAAEATPAPAAEARHAVRRSFVPGSDWLYAKLYCGFATADEIITRVIAPIAREVPAWFYLRYGDPHWHVRFRVRGEPAWLYGEVMPRLAEHARALRDSGRIWRLQLDTYEREIERYGGPAGIELAERLFCVDSACAVDIVGMITGERGNDARWRLALRGTDQLLDDLGFDLAQRTAIMRGVRDEFAREHHVETSIELQRGLGDRFRKERLALEALLDRSCDAGSALAPALDRLAARSRASAPIVAELRAAEQRGALTSSLAALAPSYIHMSINRLIRSAPRAHELVLYDLLTRLYEGQASRARSR